MNESTSYLVTLLRYTERLYVVRVFQYFKKKKQLLNTNAGVVAL